MSVETPLAPDYEDVSLPDAWELLTDPAYLEPVLVPVDAICTGGCKRTTIKSVRVSDPRKRITSFQDVCHACRGVTYWNPIEVLSGVLPEETERRIDVLERDAELSGGERP